MSLYRLVVNYGQENECEEQQLSMEEDVDVDD